MSRHPQAERALAVEFGINDEVGTDAHCSTGVRVGKRVVLGTGFAEDLPDPDMLTFKDHAIVDCLFQARTFEDRVLKMDRIVVRRGATVGTNSVLLYGADIGEGARLRRTAW